MNLVDGDDFSSSTSSVFSPSTTLPSISTSSSAADTVGSGTGSGTGSDADADADVDAGGNPSSSSHLFPSPIHSASNRRASIDIIPSSVRRNRSQSTIDISPSQMDLFQPIPNGNDSSNNRNNSNNRNSSRNNGNSGENMTLKFPPVLPTKLGKNEMNGGKRELREKESNYVEIDLMDVKTVCSWINGTVRGNN